MPGAGRYALRQPFGSLRHLTGTLATGSLLKMTIFYGDAAMVMLTEAEPVMVYRVLDGTGRAIGQVIQPRTRPVLAAGAGTILLIRNEKESAVSRRAE